MTARQQVLGGRDREEKGSLSAAEDETRKRRERAQVVGLFRYQLSCPPLEAGLSTTWRGRLVREIAARTHADPFGNRRPLLPPYAGPVVTPLPGDRHQVRPNRSLERRWTSQPTPQSPAKSSFTSPTTDGVALPAQQFLLILVALGEVVHILSGHHGATSSMP